MMARKKANRAFAEEPLTPAMATYIGRIGAEQLSFRSFMIKHYSTTRENLGYYVERAYVYVDEKGNIDIRGADIKDEWRPTAEEEEGIKREYQDKKFPTPILCTGMNAEERRVALNIDRELWYVMLDTDTRSKVIMCIQRINLDDGGKAYIPHTYFSDDNWRKMEPLPDAKLPFWKPGQKRSPQIMIHEGPRAARYVDWLCNSEEIEAKEARKVHPWYEYLRNFEHWGIHGGALAPHRADYNELRKAKASLIVYACDRDSAGENALQIVSKHYQDKMHYIRFDKRFPSNWDMADKFPKSFWEESEYIGPAIDELMGPATWATRKVRIEGSKKPVTVLKQNFVDEWFHAIRPEVYINENWPHLQYTREEFNGRMDPFADVANVAHLLRGKEASKVETLHYSPAHPTGVIVVPPRAFNTYHPSIIKPVKGDYGPFLEFMDHLFPIDSDRTEVMRWMATLIARPQIKILYGILLCSETQGVGKTTLGQGIIAPIIGLHNVNFPSETQIVDNRFNTWSAHVRLIVVNEIYQGHSFKAYNILKDLITDGYIRVNQKHLNEYQVQNWTHVFACSNSLRALKLPIEDRRWLVPEVREKARDRKYWIQFRTWLKTGGLTYICYWAHEWLKKNEAVFAADHAPRSGAKLRMVEESWSVGMKYAADFLRDRILPNADNSREGVRRTLITDLALRELIFHKLYGGRKDPDKLESPARLRKLAQDLGCWTSYPELRYMNAYYIGGFPEDKGKTRREYEQSFDIIDDFNKIDL